MLADLDDFRDRKTLADGVERQGVIGDVPIFAVCGTHQILDADADVEGARNGAAVADLAKDVVVVQLHLDLHASVDPLGKGDPQPRAGDVEDGSEHRLGWAGHDFELGGILGGVAYFRAAVGILLRGENGLLESSHGTIELIWQRNRLSGVKTDINRECYQSIMTKYLFYPRSKVNPPGTDSLGSRPGSAAAR